MNSNTVGMEVQVRIDLAEMSQMLNNEQIRALMVGIGQVIAATPEKEIPVRITEAKADSQ